MAVAALVTYAGVWVFVRLSEKPVISVDYIAKFNEMRKPEGYNPDDDGVELYMQACKAMDGVDIPSSSNRRIVIPWPGDMNDVQAKEIRQWVASTQEKFGLAEEAISKKYCWVQRYSRNGDVMGTLIPELGGAKGMCYGLIWRGKVKAFDGDVEGGLRDVMMAVRFGQTSSREECFLVEWFFGMAVMDLGDSAAMEMVARCNASSRELALLADEIELMNQPYRSPAAAIGTESLFFYDTVQRTFTDDGHGDGRPVVRMLMKQGLLWQGTSGPGSSGSARGGLGQWLSTAGTISRLEGRKATLARWDRMVAKSQELSAAEPWRLASQPGDPWRELEKDASGNILIKAYMPAFRKVAESGHRHNARVEGMLATIAVLRYQKEKATLPAGWHEVVSGGYLREIPIDRFSGKPLVYRVAGVGFTIYSVGEDGADDGGTDRKKDIVVWPPEVVSSQSAIISGAWQRDAGIVER